MIIQLELQRMVNELTKHNSDKARDYINVLNRTLLEMREQNEALKQSMMLTSNSELDGLNMIKENRKLREEVEKLTGVINELSDEG